MTVTNQGPWHVHGSALLAITLADPSDGSAYDPPEMTLRWRVGGATETVKTLTDDPEVTKLADGSYEAKIGPLPTSASGKRVYWELVWTGTLADAIAGQFDVETHHLET